MTSGGHLLTQPSGGWARAKPSPSTVPGLACQSQTSSGTGSKTCRARKLAPSTSPCQGAIYLYRVSFEDIFQVIWKNKLYQVGYENIFSYFASSMRKFLCPVTYEKIILLRYFSCFDTIFLYLYNCRHMFRPIWTHQYSQKLWQCKMHSIAI